MGPGRSLLVNDLFSVFTGRESALDYDLGPKLGADGVDWVLQAAEIDYHGRARGFVVTCSNALGGALAVGSECGGLWLCEIPT